MAKSATVSWDLPKVRESGLPLKPGDIQGVEVALAVIGADFTVLNIVPAPELELLVPDLEAGDWAFRLVCLDIADRRSAEVAVPFTIPDETPPGLVTNAGVTLS